jgi:hypothetical protein
VRVTPAAPGPVKAPLVPVRTPETVRLGLSISESLVSTPVAGVRLTGLSSVVVALSLTARGASLAGVTLTVTVLVAVPPLPSEMV